MFLKKHEVLILALYFYIYFILILYAMYIHINSCLHDEMLALSGIQKNFDYLKIISRTGCKKPP